MGLANCATMLTGTAKGVTISNPNSILPVHKSTNIQGVGQVTVYNYPFYLLCSLFPCRIAIHASSYSFSLSITGILEMRLATIFDEFHGKYSIGLGTTLFCLGEAAITRCESGWFEDCAIFSKPIVIGVTLFISF